MGISGVVTGANASSMITWYVCLHLQYVPCVQEKKPISNQTWTKVEYVFDMPRICNNSVFGVCSYVSKKFCV
jgi:hypothetical protein